MLDATRKDLIAGVAGSGTMGRGIIQVLAQCGVRVLVFDAKAGAAKAAKESIAQSLGKLVEKGRVKQKDADATLGRIEMVDDLKAETGGSTKVAGSSMEMVATGPMPGSTPISVPSITPMKQYMMFWKVSATPKPR